MHRHGAISANTAQDNKAFEDDEKNNEIKKSEFNLADINIKFKNDAKEEDGDLAYYEQPIYMNREASCISMQSGVPDLLIEFASLYFNPKSNSSCWVQRSRWLIYEEDYDLELKRYSAPHLSTVSIKGLKLFKKMFKDGHLSFNNEDIHSYADILSVYSNSVEKSKQFSEEEIENIRRALGLNHYHAGMNLSLITTEVPAFRYNENTKSFEENVHILQPIVRKRNMSSITLNETLQKVQSHKKLSECLSFGTEGLLVQVGTLETVRETHCLFIRLEQPVCEEGLIETNCPLRFVLIIFGPKSEEDELMEIGKVFSIMMSNRVFRDAVYRAESNKDIINATKNFVECSALIHLNKRITTETLANCLPQLKQYASRILAEQQRNFGNRDDKSEKKNDGLNMEYKDDTSLGVTSAELSKHNKMSRVMKQFIPPFHQVYLDLKGLAGRYCSDYKDAFTKENAPLVFSGFVFVYFVVLSPAITFGALFNSLVSPKMTITLVIVASGAFQLVYTLLSGQPLEIVGVTPTVFVVEQVLATLTTTMNIQLDIMRFWIGVYLSCFGLIFTMFNGAVIIQHFRRSVEEVYNTYFSTIFILAALFTMFKALPYTATPLNVISGNVTVYYNERVKFGIGGTTLFLALVMLNACLYLVRVNRGIYLRRSIRKILGAFNVPIGIIIVIALNLIFFQAYQLPTLNIPPSNAINFSLWVNLPKLDQVITATPAVHGYSICIGISMFFMLMVEVATNSISVAKSERKLKKPIMYSLSFLLIIGIFPLISIFLGWPFVSGAMVRSNAHCLAMAKWSANNVPGVPKKVLGECEQRISGLLVSLLVILSVFLGSALRYIPMASMYGMFLYMGVMGISEMVLWKRLINLLQRRKHWNEHDYLKDFPTWHIQILVVIQLFFVMILVLLYVLSQFTSYVWVLFIFPLFVGIYAMLRGYVLPKWPRLNKHLSKMDKKHVVKLYDGKKQEDPIAVTLTNDFAKSQDPDQLSTISDTESEIY